MFSSKADGGTSTPDSDSCDQLYDHEDQEEEFADIFRLDPTGKTTGFQIGSAFSSRTPSTESLASSTSSRPSRNRYLYPKIDTVEPLRPEQVRWFYKGEGDKKWMPFIGYDSLRIECQYREAITRTGPQDGFDKRSDLINCRGGLYQVDVVERLCHPVYWKLKGEDASIMRGMWFLDSSWQPLEDDYSTQIETEHMATFENQKIPEDNLDGKKDLPVLLTVKFKDFTVVWNAIDVVYLHSETASSKFYRAVGTKLGLAKGTKLHRGYYHEATMDDKPPDITHIVFVIHGIGQKMEEGSIIKCCNTLRSLAKKVQDKFMPDVEPDEKRVEFLPVGWRSSLKLDGDTVESITPNKVRGLRNMLNSSAMDILYYTSPLYRSEITHGLQAELNSLYQMFCNRNPYFEAKRGKVSIIAHSLGSVIAYDIITGWSPIQLYDQYVSSVIEESAVVGTQEIVIVEPESATTTVRETCSETEGASNLVCELEEARAKVQSLEAELLKMARKQHLKTPSLKFKIENFFGLGSPLAVFLCLRGIRPLGVGSQDHILPRSLCNRLFNVYHPSDPVAYRLEPLLLKSYSTVWPLMVHRYDSPNKTPYEDIKPQAYSATTPKTGKEKETKKPDIIITDVGQKKDSSLSGRLGGMFAKWSRRSANDLVAELDDVQNSAELLDMEDSTITVMPFSDGREKKVEPVDDSPIDHTELEYRLDYQLREGKMESAYISAITSHTSYWANADVALFILQQVFPDYTVS